MILIACAIRDSAANAFMRPFFVPAIGMAVRSFQDEVSRGGDSALSKHPEDYELYELGAFDEESGRFSNLAEPRSIARGKDFSYDATQSPAPGQ